MSTRYSPRSNGKAASLLGEDPGGVAREAAIEAAPGTVLHADLALPSHAHPQGAVLFAHASRLPRRDARNRVIAAALDRVGLATLLLDVFTLHEKVGYPPAADVELLSQRIVAATHWLRQQPETATLTPCYLGASKSSSAAALLAAATLGEQIGAVVSWGADSGLDPATLRAVIAPVLLIVDCHAEDLERGYEMRQRFKCATELAIVPGATHPFDQAGPVQRAARLAADWFTCHLPETARVEEPRHLAPRLTRFAARPSAPTLAS
jgi:putative phosphoribosyl transferase